MSELFQLVGKIVIDSKDAENTMDRMIEKANNLSTALGGASSSATGASESIKEVGESAETATGGVNGAAGAMENASATSVFLGNMWANIATKGISFAKGFVTEANAYNMQIEKNIGAMAAYFGGSQEKSEAFVNQLRVMDKETPYDLGGLLNAATNMAQYGVPVEELIETLETLGNIAAGDSSKLSNLARVYGQTISTGYLTGQDTLQYVSNGFGIMAALKTHLGYDGETLEKMRADKGITAEMVKEVLIAETSPGGRYYGMLDAIMATPYGAQERFKSDYAMAQGEIAEPLTESLGWLYPTLSKAVNFLADNASETRLGLNVAGTAGAYTLLSRFLPKLKGVSLKSFIKSHPLLAAAFGLVESVSYADSKAAEQDERTGLYSMPEKILGTGEGKYSGWFGELKEMPQDIKYTLTREKLPNEITLADVLLNGGNNTTPALSTKQLEYHGYRIAETVGLTAQLGQMIALLSQIASNSNQPIYLNTGALVGGLLPEINVGFGKWIEMNGGGD